MTTNKTPQSVLPEHPEDPVTDTMLLEAYAASDPPTDGYVNFGDANPEHHGGIWLSWSPNAERWTVVSTQPLTDVIGIAELREELGDGVEFDHPGHQYVRIAFIDPGDIFTESGEWTADMSRQQEELHRGHESPDGAIVDGTLTKNVAHFADSGANDLSRVARDPDTDLPPGSVVRDSYALVLDYVGVVPAE